jgi:hypothetical protein
MQSVTTNVPVTVPVPLSLSRIAVRSCGRESARLRSHEELFVARDLAVPAPCAAGWMSRRVAQSRACERRAEVRHGIHATTLPEPGGAVPIPETPTAERDRLFVSRPTALWDYVRARRSSAKLQDPQPRNPLYPGSVRPVAGRPLEPTLPRLPSPVSRIGLGYANGIISFHLVLRSRLRVDRFLRESCAHTVRVLRGGSRRERRRQRSRNCWRRQRRASCWLRTRRLRQDDLRCGPVLLQCELRDMRPERRGVHSNGVRRGLCQHGGWIRRRAGRLQLRRRLSPVR